VRSASADWLTLPPLRPTRWWVPAGPRTVAYTGLKLYQPMTAWGRTGWLTARLAARLGGFSLLAPGHPPPDDVLERVTPHLPKGGPMAVMRLEHGGRFVVLMMNRAGQPATVAKVALSAAGERALHREARDLAAYGRGLVPPLSAPCVLASAPGLLVLDAVDWQMQWRPWRLTNDIASALGVLHRTGRSGRGSGLAHGDCAPWNLLRQRHGWVLLDWECADPDAPAYYDILHFLFQSFTNLGRPSQRAIVRGVSTRQGWIGKAVQAYADAAELDSAEAVEYLRLYPREPEAGARWRRRDHG
jgi:hypothetical protein